MTLGDIALSFFLHIPVSVLYWNQQRNMDPQPDITAVFEVNYE
jgi:hypothetical protein